MTVGPDADLAPDAQSGFLGIGRSLAGTGIVLVAILFGQGLTLTALALARGVPAGRDLAAAVAALAGSGLALALSTLLAVPIAWLGVIAVIRRGTRLAPTAYLGLRAVRPAPMAAWLLAIVGFLLAAGSLDPVFERPEMPEFMLEAYASAGSRPLLWLAVVAGAPLFEEVLFRGFALPGIARALGALPGIALVSALWAITHVQYDLYDQLVVLALGILLGGARLSTGSLYVPLAMHAVVNGLGMLQIAFR